MQCTAHAHTPLLAVQKIFIIDIKLAKIRKYENNIDSEDTVCNTKKVLKYMVQFQINQKIN